MSEIKYKVWCKNRHEWEQNDIAICPDGNILHWEAPKQLPDFIKKERYDIVLYTGFNDRYDSQQEELYERDIVKVLSHYDGDYFVKETIGLITMLDGEWSVVDKNKNNICSLWDYVNNWCGGKIGNSYDNPELLK